MQLLATPPPQRTAQMSRRNLVLLALAARDLRSPPEGRWLGIWNCPPLLWRRRMLDFVADQVRETDDRMDLRLPLLSWDGPLRRGAGDEADAMTPEKYALQRAEYIRAGKGTPAPGAIPLPNLPPETKRETQ